MKKIALLLLFLAGCRGNEDQPNEAAPVQPTAERQQAGAGLTTLTGLYEGGSAGRPNQLCVTEGEGDAHRFGLVVWGANDHSCSGSGTVRRAGANLALAMAGDSSCTITAPISGTTVTLPATLPPGCAYYCGARAQLGGASFSQRGSTKADALRAKDLVGDPLCEG